MHAGVDSLCINSIRQDADSSVSTSESCHHGDPATGWNLCVFERARVKRRSSVCVYMIRYVGVSV